MDAKNAFKKLQYRRGHWVHDYLRGLLQYKEDMAHVGVEITDEELMIKFKEEVIPKHDEVRFQVPENRAYSCGVLMPQRR